VIRIHYLVLLIAFVGACMQPVSDESSLDQEGQMNLSNTMTNASASEKSTTAQSGGTRESSTVLLDVSDDPDVIVKPMPPHDELADGLFCRSCNPGWLVFANSDCISWYGGNYYACNINCYQGCLFGYDAASWGCCTNR